MDVYEELQDKAAGYGLSVGEYPFTHHDGLIIDKKIGIRQSIASSAQKADVLAEEIAHYEVTVGDILDQTIPMNRKQEHRARIRAHDMRIGLEGIIRVFEAGCHTPHEAAEYLGVSEQFFNEAVECYRRKYGECIETDNYILFFEPSLDVIRLEGQDD